MTETERADAIVALSWAAERADMLGRSELADILWERIKKLAQVGG